MLRIKSVPALKRRGNFTTSQIVIRFANAWGLLRQLKLVWQVLFTTEKFRSFSLRTQRKRCVYLRLPLVILCAPPWPWTVGSGGVKGIVIFNELPKLIFCNDVETGWNVLLLPCPICWVETNLIFTFKLFKFSLRLWFWNKWCLLYNRQSDCVARMTLWKTPVGIIKHHFLDSFLVIILPVAGNIPDFLNHKTACLQWLIFSGLYFAYLPSFLQSLDSMRKNPRFQKY